ncbi:TPA: hypothetical protein ACGWER_001731 [Streptococcus agalactiae]
MKGFIISILIFIGILIALINPYVGWGVFIAFGAVVAFLKR